MRSRVDRDLTLIFKLAGPGMSFTRCCSFCSKNKISLGGRTCKRTKRWRCGECVAKIMEQPSA